MVHQLQFLSFRMTCSSFLSSKFASKLKLINLWWGSVASLRMLGVYRSWSEDSGSQDRSSWVPGPRVSGSGSQVPGSRVSGPGSRVPGLGSQDPRSQVPVSRVPGLRSQVLILDYPFFFISYVVYKSFDPSCYSV